MNRISVALVVSALLTAPVGAKTLTVALDVSGSNPLVSDARYAQIAAGYVRDKVSALQPGDVVSLHTLADRSLANFPSERIEITRRNRADKVAARIAQFMATMPTRHFEGQESTNIMGFFAFGQFDCTQGGEILLVTDGIESSPDMKAERLLAGKPLPKPDKNLLSGCTVTMFGVGQASAGGQLSPVEVKHIRAAWTSWMTVAGAHYNAIIDP
jgi:hypothetical protein